MAALTIATDMVLTTVGGAYTNQTGANSLLALVYDGSNFSAAVGMNDGSYTQHDLTSSDMASGAPTAADLSYARGFSSSVRYGQIFPRTVYGN